MKKFKFVLVVVVLLPLSAFSQTFDSTKVSYTLEYKKIDNLNPHNLSLVFADSLDINILWDASQSFGSASDSLFEYDTTSGWIEVDDSNRNDLSARVAMRVEKNSTYSFRIWAFYEHSPANIIRSIAPSEEYVIFIDQPMSPPARVIRLRLKL